MDIIQFTLDRVTLGMKIAEDIYNGNRLLIQKNTIVDDSVLRILRYNAIPSIPVYGIKLSAQDSTKPEEPQEDSSSEKKVSPEKAPEPEKKKIPLKKSIPEETQKTPTHAQEVRNSFFYKEVKKKFERATNSFAYELNDIAHKNSNVNIDDLFKYVNDITDGITNTYQLMNILSNIEYFDDATYAHSLNVALLANVLGRWLHLDSTDLKNLTVAGMLHDIGKIFVPADIIKKPTSLTSDEFESIKQHPRKGYELLRGKVSEPIAQVALSHHEKCDGKGYPHGIGKDKLSAFTRIITIVDIYEALTANRCYHKQFCPFRVIEMFEEEIYTKYDPAYLLPFLQGISDTYVNNTVQLSDGRIGKIIMTNKNALSKPVVLTGNQFIDLSQNPKLRIVSIL